MIAPTETRFWPKVDRSNGPDACWIWRASFNPRGYAQFWDKGRVLRAHRYAYELLVGPIPDGLQLDHLCRDKRCCNPAHLEPVTAKENVRRGVPFRTGVHKPYKKYKPRKPRSTYPLD